jgi:Flp pilus assembly pilin Flp
LRFGETLDSLGQGSRPNRKKGDHKMINMLKNLHKEESGQDLIEYALIGLLIALSAVVIMGTLGKAINNEFSKIAAQLS